MKKLILFVCLLLVILSLGIYIMTLYNQSVKDLTNNDSTDYYKRKEFKGLVIKKFIDKYQHNSRTIIIKENNDNDTLIMDFVMGNVYQYIKEGDSLSKNKGSLDLNLKRNDLDTIIHMEIYNREEN